LSTADYVRRCTFASRLQTQTSRRCHDDRPCVGTENCFVNLPDGGTETGNDVIANDRADTGNEVFNSPTSKPEMTSRLSTGTDAKVTSLLVTARVVTGNDVTVGDCADTGNDVTVDEGGFVDLPDETENALCLRGFL